MEKQEAKFIRGSRFIFGRWKQYEYRAMRDRFGNLVHFVTDAEQMDEAGLPSIIRQTEVFDGLFLNLGLTESEEKHLERWAKELPHITS